MINDRGGVMYSSHASSYSGLPRYPTNVYQDTYENMSSKNQLQPQTPPWMQNSYLQSYSGNTNRSGTPASQMRGPSPVTTINPVTMNTNSSIGTGGINTAQYQSKFQVSVQTNSRLNSDRNNIAQNNQQFNQEQQMNDYSSRALAQNQLRSNSKDFITRGSNQNYTRSRSHSRDKKAAATQSNYGPSIHSKHSSIYSNNAYTGSNNNVHNNNPCGEPKQNFINSGSTTLSNYQIPEAMKYFFSKQNPISIESNRTSQNQNYPSSRRYYDEQLLKNQGAGVYMNLKMNNQVVPLQDPPVKLKNKNNFTGTIGQYPRGDLQNRRPSGVQIMDTVEQLQVTRAKQQKREKYLKLQDDDKQLIKNQNKENIGPDSQSKRAIFKSCTNITKRTIFGSMNCSDDEIEQSSNNKNELPPSLVNALKESETYVHKS